MSEQLDELTFAHHLNTLLTDPKPSHIAVAVSGGADSTCLALLLKNWTEQQKIQLTALTIDHQLRPESASEAASVKAMMYKLGIEHHTLQWKHNGLKTKIQETAREARYQLLITYCLQHNISHLCLAHHCDDQAETFLYRLSRSSGMDGLASMRSLSLNNGIYIVRPFLYISKNVIESYLKDKGISWIEDPSNKNMDFTRVKIRQFIPRLQAIGINAQTLKTVTQKIQRSRDALEFYTKEFLKNNSMLFKTGYVKLHKPEKWPPEDVLLRALNWILWHVSGSSYPPRQNRTEILMQKIHAENFKPTTCGGCYIIYLGESFIFMREHKPLSDITIQQNSPIYWDKRFEITVSNIKETIKVGPVGACRNLRILFPDIPHYVLEGLPALKKGKEIIAVPCLNLYPSPSTINQQNIVDWSFNPRKNLFRVLFTIA